MKKIAAISLLILFSWPLTLLAAEEGDRCFCYNTIDGCDRPGIYDPTTLEQCRIDCDQIYEDYMEEDLGVVRAVFSETTDADYTDALDDCLDAAALVGPHAAALVGPPVIEKRKPVVPYLAVEIPNLTFTPLLEDGDYLTVNWLGEYVVALYKWLLSTAIIVATVMIMVGGVQYMVEDPEKGKARIRSAVTGLILLFGSYVILYTVNPQLTLFEPLRIKYIGGIPEDIAGMAYGEGGECAADLWGVSKWQDCMLSTYGNSKSEVERNLVTITHNGQSYKVHKLALESFEKAFTQISTTTTYDTTRSTAGGTYNWRCNKNSPGKLSPHAFGVAIDVNPDTNINCPRSCREGGSCQYCIGGGSHENCVTICQNGLHGESELERISNGQHDLPPEVIEAFQINNFDWGGRWKGVYDYMHFHYRGACYI